MFLAAAGQSLARPNVVFFLVDDLGIKDLSCYGSDFHESPEIDSLARDGVQFMNAYASHPVCGPSRTAIVTGCFPSRFGVNAVGGSIPKGQVIWPHVLKDAGYHTWFGGKWHLGSAASVKANGFDYNITGCNRGQPADFYFPYKGVPLSQSVTELSDGKPGDYLTDAITDKALDFLDTHGEDPFLLYLSFYNVHKPANPLGYKKGTPTRYVQGKKEHNRYFEEKLAKLAVRERAMQDEAYAGGNVQMATLQREPEFASQIKAVDENIGRVLDKLDELKATENTIVIFTSDQGSMATSKIAVSSALPYRFGKGFVYEGGVRVPLIIKWPGHAKPNTKNETVTISTDIYPTVLELLGMPLNPQQHQDGISLAKALNGETLPFDRTFQWAYPHNHSLGHQASVAVRHGPHKLIYWPNKDRTEVYHVEKDPSERKDLSQTQPELTQRLRKQLDAWTSRHPLKKKR